MLACHCGFLSFAVQVVAEERGFDVFAELAGGFVSPKRNQADAVALVSLPLAMEPRSGNDEVGVLRIVFFGMAKDLPRSPGIFLIPESGDIQIGHGRRVKLAHPGFLFPEFVVVGMFDAGIPVRNRAVKIFCVDIGERPRSRYHW